MQHATEANMFNSRILLTHRDLPIFKISVFGVDYKIEKKTGFRREKRVEDERLWRGGFVCRMRCGGDTAIFLDLVDDEDQ